MATQLDRIEYKLDQIIQYLNATQRGYMMPVMGSMQSPLRPEPEERGPGPERNAETRKCLADLTPKQHAIMQMIVEGHSNREVAERLRIAENTVKVHVRDIAKKLGTAKRSGIIGLVATALEGMSDTEYRHLSGNLPKNWSENYIDPDPHKHLYS